MKIISHKVTKIIATSALALSATGCINPQAPSSSATTPTPTETFAPGVVGGHGPALWKVADDDTTIYLFGTIHALPKDVDWYSETIASALDASDALVTEIYVPKGSESQIQQTFAAKGTLPTGASLRDMLSKADRQTFEDALTALKLPAQTFDRQEPWLAAVTLSLMPLLLNGYSPQQGVEKAVEAKAGDKPRMQLESVEFQVDILDQLPITSQKQYLVSVASNIDEILPVLDKIVAEWAVGDTAGLDQLMNVDYGDPAITDALYTQRNRNWAGWIDHRLDQPGTVFVAVGAGHLAGKNSVQAVLAGNGITTIRVQ